MKKVLLTILIGIITIGGYYYLMRPPVVEANNPTNTTPITDNSTTSQGEQSSDDDQSTLDNEIVYLGTITIVVVDESGNEVINDRVGYVAGDTLFTLLDKNYEVGCANSSYKLSDVCEPLALGSRILLKVDDVVTDWTSSYLAIYIDDVYATKGLDLIEIEDGKTYKFEYKGI